MSAEQATEFGLLTKGAEARAKAAKEDFGRRLYKMMLARNMTQSDLARAAGLERNRISTYVRGVSLPQGLSLKKVADLLASWLQRPHPAGAELAAGPLRG